jgi:diguanylate cyclase
VARLDTAGDGWASRRPGWRPIAPVLSSPPSTVSTQITVLALSRSPRQRADALLALADRLLHLIAGHAPDDPSLQSERFLAQVERWRTDLKDEDDPERLNALVDEAAGAVSAFLERVQVYRDDREHELVELVHVLRDVIDAVKGDSDQYELELLRSTTELGRMAEIEDIRELKRSLAREVKVLREAVADHRAKEAKHYATLSSRVQSLEQSLVKAKADAATDALTGLPNRGAFDAALVDWARKAAGEKASFALAMVDLDDFKRINDTYGHPVGDRVIVAAAQVLQRALGAGELAARFGGEEFAVLLRVSSAGKAKQRLTQLLESLPPSYQYEVDGKKGFVSFTFSAGVTAWAAGDTPESIVKRADEALYDAKRKGKKRVETRPQAFLRGLIGG